MYCLIAEKIYVPKETKYINVTAFNLISNKDEVKAMTEHISCDCKCNFISTSCNSHRKWKNKTCQCQYKNYKCNEGYSWNCRTCICENSKNLKSVADNLVADCDEIIIVLDIVSTKKTNIIATKRANITSTASINYHRKKVRDCYICRTVLLLIILVLIIFICYHYMKQKGTV